LSGLKPHWRMAIKFDVYFIDRTIGTDSV